MPGSRRTWLIAGFALLAVAYAMPVAGLGWNQGAHYAQIEALSHGTGRVDAYRWQSGDLAWYRGHYYSTKAPGLAFLGEPFYLAMRATGLLGFIARHTSSAWQAAQVSIWVLGLCVVVAATVVLLLLVRAAGERLAPGYGATTALTLGVGTLVLPYSTVFFSHVVSAALGFGAFMLIWRSGEREPPPARLALAGVVAGFGVAVEYTVAIVCLALAVYLAAAAGRRIVRIGSFAGGAAIGVAPLLIYNQLVYGSITHVSYVNAIARRGGSGHQVVGENARGLFGFSWPDPRVAFEVLFDSRGLFITAPVLIMGVVGLVLMRRSGRRAEALTWGGIAVGFLVFNAGYFLPFGGVSAGPRFLIPALPFLAAPLALAYRRWPGPTAALAVASGVILLCATATHPMLSAGDTGLWPSDLAAGNFTETITNVLGLGNGLGLAVFVVAVLGAVASFLLVAAPRRASTGDLRNTGLLLVLWLAAATGASVVAGAGWPAVSLDAAAAALGFGAVALVRVSVERRPEALLRRT